MLKKAKKWEKKHGRAIDDIVLSNIYGCFFDGTPIECDQRTRATYVKLWMELTVPKIAADPGADKALGPAVYLPEHRPTLSVIPGGKSA